MAELLYRLGRFSARHAWKVITAWVVVLGLSVGAFLAFGGALSSAITIPGTATTKVTDQLAEDFPDASGGSGTVVFHADDDGTFTDAQKTAVGVLLEDTADIDGVDSTTDPFVTQAEIDDQAREVTDGKTQIADATTALDDGQAQLDDAAQMLADAQTELDTAREESTTSAGLAQLDAQQFELDAQQAELDSQQGVLDDTRAQLKEQGEELGQASRLLEMSSEIRMVSDDNSTALASITFDEAQQEIDPESKTEVVDYISENLPDGVGAEFTSELTQEIPEIFGIGEVVGLIIAAITLLVMLGSVIAAALPILTAIVGVGVGVTAALSLSGTLEMISVTPVLGVMLGLAVGIDYSLFILNRHRKQLLEGVDLQESIGLANGTSGNAVVFAGATVLVALLALNVTGIPFLGLMGTVGAICVAVAILIAITMTPALLSLIGIRVLNRKARARLGQRQEKPADIKPLKTARAWITVIASIVLLGVVATPALEMRLGLPDGTSEAVDSTQYKAYTLIEENFGDGVNGPLLVVADLPDAISDDDLVAQQVEIGQELLDRDGVSAVAPIGASDDNTVLAFQVIPEEGPSSESTEQLVHDLRDLSPLDGNIELGVAGSASGAIDVSQTLADSLPIYLAVVIGLSLIIMVFVFRSILVPITATIGFIMSLFATFGGMTAIFQWGWLSEVFGVHDPAPIMSFLPTVLIGILFGLSMDYQLFLVSGMREAYTRGASARIAVQQGVRAGRTVVIAAAIIMISVFGGFIFSNSAIIRSLGFGLAFGVLVDAFVVRLLFIPAVMHLLGKWAWWLPRWLDRILPNVDVEGAALEHRHLHVDALHANDPDAADCQLDEDAASVHVDAHVPRETSIELNQHAHLVSPKSASLRRQVRALDAVHTLDVAVHDLENGRRRIDVGSFVVTVDADSTAVVEPPTGGVVIVRSAGREAD
ncbi:RND transporter [Microbacterium sp. CH12i]|uniref:MMPL family transporter n=1 Tax=Microbacterium sp. CH12i TaxID=1479651 RepID=UPI0004616DA6|nr:MMPL family transporter [Microbacterium sp. CH12i]KDA05372.1 RND transporter [Microbacterium sp. CH12i]